MSAEIEVENSRNGEGKTLSGETMVTPIPEVPPGERYPPRESWPEAKLSDVAAGRKVILSPEFRRSGIAGSFMSGDESVIVC